MASEVIEGWWGGCYRVAAFEGVTDWPGAIGSSRSGEAKSAGLGWKVQVTVSH